MSQCQPFLHSLVNIKYFLFPIEYKIIMVNSTGVSDQFFSMREAALHSVCYFLS